MKKDYFCFRTNSYSEYFILKAFDSNQADSILENMMYRNPIDYIIYRDTPKPLKDIFRYYGIDLTTPEVFWFGEICLKCFENFIYADYGTIESCWKCEVEFNKP